MERRLAHLTPHSRKNEATKCSEHLGHSQQSSPPMPALPPNRWDCTAFSCGVKQRERRAILRERARCQAHRENPTTVHLDVRGNSVRQSKLGNGPRPAGWVATLGLARAGQGDRGCSLSDRRPVLGGSALSVRRAKRAWRTALLRAPENPPRAKETRR